MVENWTPYLGACLRYPRKLSIETPVTQLMEEYLIQAQ